jgi:thiamine kinase-like enzyme
MLNHVPKKRRDSLKAALLSAFGRADLQEFNELFKGGSTAKIYRIQVNGNRYVVRLMALEEAQNLRKSQIECYQVAVKMGIAPACYYAEAEVGIIIMDFIETKKINVNTGWLAEVAGMLRSLHGYEKPFPLPPEPLFCYIQGLITTLTLNHTTNCLIEYIDKFKAVLTLLTPHLIQKPCHNDLNKYNLLFDTKCYLIDWEAAGQEDPFFDLATICIEFISSSSQEDHFLLAYFGSKPTKVQEAKLLCMKQVSYGYLALHYLLHAQNGGLELKNEIIQEMRANLKSWIKLYRLKKEELNGPLDFLYYALMQIEISLNQMRATSFKDAVTILKN